MKNLIVSGVRSLKALESRVTLIVSGAQLREGTTDHFSCFFIKLIKGGGGGSFPFIKIYVVDFIYSGGLWQHEIGIEKVF